MQKKQWLRTAVLRVAVLTPVVAFAVWAQYDVWKKQSTGFIPIGYTQADVTDVYAAAMRTLDCWLVQSGIDCFLDSVDPDSPFFLELYIAYEDVPKYHSLGAGFNVDTDTLGMFMGMNLPEEERRLFANSKTFMSDGMAITFLGGADRSVFEKEWRARLCEICTLPNLTGEQIAEVLTVIKSPSDASSITLSMYFRATSHGWRLFDWRVS